MDNEKLSILRILVENREKELSIRQLSMKRKINYKSAYENIKKLEKEGVILAKRKGNITLCSFNNAFNDSVFLVEYKRRDELLKNKDFKELCRRLGKVDSQFVLLLFGSYARGTSTRSSDIDLLLISDDPKPIENEADLMPLKIHITSITYKNFKQMLKSREDSVVSEAIKNNVILFGTEDFYRMVGNAG